MPQLRSHGPFHALASFCDRLGGPPIDATPGLRRRASVDNRRLDVPNDPHLGVDGHDEGRRAPVQFLSTLPRPPAAIASRRPASSGDRGATPSRSSRVERPSLGSARGARLRQPVR